MPGGRDDAGCGGKRFLAGREILITRPRDQAAALAHAVADAGGAAIVFPTIQVAPLEDMSALDAALARLDAFDLVVFVSANAAIQADMRARATGRPGLSAIACAAAPGPGTAAELADRGVSRVIVPARRFDSDGLIEALRNHDDPFARVLIVRGSDAVTDAHSGAGREQLATWLRARGARVDVVAAYRRVRAEVEPGLLASMLRRPAPAAAVITSSEGGEHLLALLGDVGRSWLAATPLFVPHARIAERMRALGLGEARLTAGGDDGVMLGLAEYFGGARR
jgi:uroporphyrinogen-III synthase